VSMDLSALLSCPVGELWLVAQRRRQHRIGEFLVYALAARSSDLPSIASGSSPDAFGRGSGGNRIPAFRLRQLALASLLFLRLDHRLWVKGRSDSSAIAR